MNAHRNPISACALLLFACACTNEGYTKGEARDKGHSPDGEDICEDWNDDGVCDDFCPEADSDCNVDCLAVPACSEGETAHQDPSECPQDTSCREVTVCSQTIWCSGEGGLDCLEAPTCEAGETLHQDPSECPQDTSCREVTVCSQTVWCSGGCAGENPQGCASRGCDAGYVCDTTQGSGPSACSCDTATGSWICTADMDGGVCVPDAP